MARSSGSNTIRVEVRRSIIKLDLHPDSSKRLDEMRLIRQHKSWILRIEYRFRNGIEDAIPDTAIEHSNDTPDARLGAMLAA